MGHVPAAAYSWHTVGPIVKRLPRSDRWDGTYAVQRDRPLFPQPGGFEGITCVVELANAHDHPVPDRE
jgi:hypothetical protein